MEAAMTGHPVYTTLHSNGVAETIRRLVITFPPEERQGRTIDIIETVRLVISQRSRMIIISADPTTPDPQSGPSRSYFSPRE